MPNLTISQALAQADLLVDRPTIDAAIAAIAGSLYGHYMNFVRLSFQLMEIKHMLVIEIEMLLC